MSEEKYVTYTAEERKRYIGREVYGGVKYYAEDAYGMNIRTENMYRVKKHLS